MEINFYLKKQKILTLFLILALSTVGIDFLTQHYLLTDRVYYNSFSEQLSMDQIEGVINIQSKSLYFIYPIDIIMLFIKCGLIAFILQAGLFFRKIDISFSDIFKIAIVAEFIFLTPQIIKFIWFDFAGHNYTIDELKSFFPLSAVNIFEPKTLPLLWYYPLKTLNLFEILYWFILGFFISNLIEKDFNTSLNIVLTSYLPALIIWVSFIMFLIVALNPV